jgi:hypothetical protein
MKYSHHQTKYTGKLVGLRTYQHPGIAVYINEELSKSLHCQAWTKCFNTEERRGPSIRIYIFFHLQDYDLSQSIISAILLKGVSDFGVENILVNGS